jgi:hypothetical protein
MPINAGEGKFDTSPSHTRPVAILHPPPSILHLPSSIFYPLPVAPCRGEHLEKRASPPRPDAAQLRQLVPRAHRVRFDYFVLPRRHPRSSLVPPSPPQVRPTGGRPFETGAASTPTREPAVEGCRKWGYPDPKFEATILDFQITEARSPENSFQGRNLRPENGESARW